jgi:hypothetical protein
MVIGLFSRGWTRRACAHCRGLTRERVRHMSVLSLDIRTDDIYCVSFFKKRPLHFRCNEAKPASDSKALRPAHIHDGKVFVHRRPTSRYLEVGPPDCPNPV